MQVIFRRVATIFLNAFDILSYQQDQKRSLSQLNVLKIEKSETKRIIPLIFFCQNKGEAINFIVD